METLGPNSPPTKRFKSDSQTLTLDPHISPSIKGKAPISDQFDVADQFPMESPPQSCGICFSDEGKSVRGVIDSCDHYFCFLCIIEWSKIESRCPLCRARFSNIRRMRRDRSFIGDGSVKIPVRDQIYDHFGEPTADPYAQAKCTVCDGHTDESLLLLCDLCDTAWHTYCVGLGVTVPEGDWYCRDCTLLRAEQRDEEEGDVNVDQSNTSNNNEGSSSTSTSISIFDIVRDEEPELDSGVSRLRKIVSAPTKPSSLMIVSDRVDISSSGSKQSSRCNLRSPTNVMESSARTLRNCRNVHRHISVLRENWDAFRTGSLSFSSNSLGSSHRNRKTNVVTSLPPTITPHSQDTSCDTQSNKPYDVDRAWKLMNIARSMQQIRPHKGGSKAAQPTLNKAPVSKPNNVAIKDHKFPMAQMRKPSDKVNRSERIQLNNIVSKDASTSGSKYPNSSMSRLFSSRKLQAALEEDASRNRRGLQSQRKLQSNLRTKEISTTWRDQVGNVNACSASEAGGKSSTQGEFCYGRASVASQQISVVSANVLNEKKGSDHSQSRCEPLTGSSNGPQVKLQRGESLKCPYEVGSQTGSKSSNDNDVKGEIQSLVKLNLKLLTKDNRLAADAFKEIARISTHTILAACGYEHRKIIHSYQTIECRHVDQPQQASRCTLMPSSCRECFYVFVKNVVSSVTSDKLNS